MHMEPHVWVETPLSEPAFAAALQDGSYFTEPEAALKDADDFLRLVKQPWPTVVVCVEGYLKLQAAALDRQLPPELQAMNTVGLNGLPQPAPLVWQPSPNLLHPQQLLARELTGCTSSSTARQPLCCPVSQLEPVPFAVVERCKLLQVQYVQKELYQQPQHRSQQAQQHAHEPAHTQQQQHPQQQQAPQPMHHQVWGAEQATPAAVQQPLCRRLSVRVVLQRLPAEPLPDEDPASVNDSSWQHRGLQGSGDTQHVAYTCTLEYPAFTINSSDYLVPAALFYEGLRSWQALQKGEAFTMLWDGNPWGGSAQGYRQRRPGDPFTGSPWWSIKLEWEGHQTDRTDPEDFRFGNPWEMTREGRPPQLPDARTALAALNLAGHPVLAAPWTAVWAAVEADAAAHAKAKRKRQGHHHHDDDFIYEEGPVEDAAADAADLWDPTDFYYDDDPEDFEVELDEHVQPRRKSSCRQQQQSAGRRRSGSRRSSTFSGAAAAGGTCCSRQHKAAAAPGELTHNYGRELLARSDVCVVCGSAEGSLMSGHTGRSGGNCTRQYHAGCLLLLNAAGIRSVMLAKSAPQQQRKRGQAGSSGASSRVPAAAANSLCDGLLGLLWQQSQQPDHQLSPAVVGAVAAAREAAARVAAGELVLICPSHGCHGCQLNGKLEFMVWCCCCWIRVYHHRQCVPYGAEHVKVDGRDFIRCPHCRAAGMPVPDSAAAAAAGRVAAFGPSAAAAGLFAAAAAAVATSSAIAGMAASGSAGQATPAAAAGAGAGSSSEHEAAGSGEPHATPAAVAGAGAGIPSRYEAAATAMQTDQQPAAALQQAPTPPSQQQQSSDTLQGVSSAGGSTEAARDGSAEPVGPAQPAAVLHEMVDLLDSSDPGDPDQEDSGPEVIMIDSSSEPEDQQAHGDQQRVQMEMQMPYVQDDRSEPGTAAAAAAADGGGGDGGGDMMAMVAALDAQLAALRQQRQAAPEQQQQEHQHVCTGSWEAAGATGLPPAAAAVAGQQGHAAYYSIPMHAAAEGALNALQELAAAAELEQLAAGEELQQHVQGPSIPPWLQLALEDRERVSPSYILVPCTSPDAAGSSRGHSSSGADASTIGALEAAVAAGGTLPPPHAAAVRGAGDVFEGLPLSSPHSHWLLGCLAKAEAQYKPANVWGCAMIGVPLCPDDSLYGLAVVVDFLPALQQQHTAMQAGLALPAAAGGGDATAAAARARPQVYLRCSKNVAANGRLQPALQARGEDERRQGREWQVLVNGVPYPARQGRSGVALRLGDVVTVQGLSFKLQLAQ